MAIDVTFSMETITCCHAGCGIVFAIPEYWQVKRRKDHTSWYCPNGHSQSYQGQTEEEKLRGQLAREQERAGIAERDARAKADLLASERRKLKRLRTRAKAGVCPAGCKRHFTNLER